MIHPHTELKFISKEIGYGIFATQAIPKGTITWVKDSLDRSFHPNEIKNFSENDLNNLMKYTYRDRNGHYFFCWDLTRYVNHSFKPNTILTSLNFEIAIRDIAAGEEITNDYGTLNLIEAFECAKGPCNGRTHVYPDDLVTFQKVWDHEIALVFYKLKDEVQPLETYLTAGQKKMIDDILLLKKKIPSIIENYCGNNPE